MNTKETDNNIQSSPSPFHLEEHWCIQTENHNRNCTHAEIDTLLSKGLLNRIDLEIIKLLGTWKYVNTHNIAIALNRMLPLAYQKEDYSHNLKKMAKAGILLRHFISSSKYEEPRKPISPLRFYSLSAGARSYIIPFLDMPACRPSFLSDLQIMESLAVSQFMIRLQSLQQIRITALRSQVIRKADSSSLFIPAECNIRVKQGRPPIKLFVLCGRSHSDSMEKAIQNACMLLKQLSVLKDTPFLCMIILLLESMHDIPTVHMRISLQASGINLSSMYYTTDNAIYAEQIRDSLYQCSEDDGIFSINRIRFYVDENE